MTLARIEVWQSQPHPRHRCKPPLEHEAHESHAIWRCQSGGHRGAERPRWRCDCGAVYIRTTLGWELLAESGGEALA